jgi:class 3 adenylate cyclase
VTDVALVAGRYEIIETISTGERGSLHKALDRDLDRFVALKTLVLGDATSVEELRSETKILHELQHANLPTVRHDFVLPDGGYVMVIDWVDGVDLEEKLATGGRPGLVLSSVIDWIGQVAEALDYLHHQEPPIVHGDVKPSNIVLSRTNRVVLLDFGIARRAGQVSNAGTHGFMAPEVAMGEPVSPATDVYGLVATSYTLLTGKPPGSGPPDIPDIDRAHSAAIEQVLEHGLATDPARRFASAGRFAERLRPAHDSLPPSTKTLLATEVVDYDELWDRDPALMDEFGPGLESIVRIAVDEGDGRVSIDSGGERMLAGFLSASAALRTALAVRSRLTDDLRLRDGGVRLRLALHTGEPEHDKGHFRGASVNKVQRLCRAAAPGQILVSASTAPLLFDRLPPTTRLVELAEAPNGASTATSGPSFSLETGELPARTAEPSPTRAAVGPVVAPPKNAPPPRRRRSEKMERLVRERNEADDATNRQLRQQDEAQRAGQPGLAAKYGEHAAASAARRKEIDREIERLEVQEGDDPTG